MILRLTSIMPSWWAVMVLLIVSVSGEANPYLGQITMFGGNFAPRGWAVCDGQLLPIASYSALFSILGTTYGGDGRTTFALPDMRSRAPVHAGNGPGLSPYNLGQKGGKESVTLNAMEIPSHSHKMKPRVAKPDVVRDTQEVSDSWLGGNATCQHDGDGSRRRLLQTSGADPGFPLYGHTAIRPDPTPGVVGEVTTIMTLVENYGAAAATDVEVRLSFNDWGVSYQGWQEIGTVSIASIAGEGSAEESFDHVFENRAHTCLLAEIVGASDNADSSNDRTQINWEVVHADEVLNMMIPFINGADHEVEVGNLEVLCLNDDGVGACKVRGEQPYLEAEGVERLLGAGGLPAQSEQLVELVLPEVDDEVVVVVQAELNGELNHVMLHVVKSSVEELLSAPHLCCIGSIRTRLLLESVLSAALDAYHDGDCRLALKLLRSFMSKAALLECELSLEERACLERAMRKVVDAARMIVAEGGFAARPYLIDGDYYRRAGQYAAAILTYAKGCGLPEPPLSTPPTTSSPSAAATTSSSTSAAPTSSSTTSSAPTTSSSSTAVPTSSSSTTTAPATTSSSTTTEAATTSSTSAAPTTTPMPEAEECYAPERRYISAAQFASEGEELREMGNPVHLRATGGGSAHDNLQPYIVINYIIALQGVFPSRS